MAIQIRTSLSEPETGETFVPHRPQRPAKAEGGRRFVIKSDYEPAGDQPTAIAELVAASREGEKTQVLLGVTGSGKTFTMAKVIEELQRPALVLAPNQGIQQQWPRAVGQFTRTPADVAGADVLKPIACLSYQALCQLEDPEIALGRLAPRLEQPAGGEPVAQAVEVSQQVRAVLAIDRVDEHLHQREAPGRRFAAAGMDRPAEQRVAFHGMSA